MERVMESLILPIGFIVILELLEFSFSQLAEIVVETPNLDVFKPPRIPVGRHGATVQVKGP